MSILILYCVNYIVVALPPELMGFMSIVKGIDNVWTFACVYLSNKGNSGRGKVIILIIFSLVRVMAEFVVAIARMHVIMVG